MQISRTKRLKIALALAAALALSLALIVTASQGGKNNKTARSRPVAKSASRPVTRSASLFKDSALGRPDRDRFKRFIKDKKQFFSAEEASKELPFKLKLPTSKAVGKLYGIFIDEQDGELPPSAMVYYGDGAEISFSARLSDPKYDAKAYVDQMVASKEAGELKSNNVPFLVDINGFAGAAQEPGYNIILSDKRPRPGYVSWEDDDGIRYSLGGASDENTTNVETFIEVARSIRN